MASILNSTNSAYYPSFQNMMSKVVAALKEALDISLYLEPLIEQFEVKNKISIMKFHYKTNLYHQVLESTDFVDMRPLIPPLMHSICLVYSHSKYYNTTSRIIVLMQVIGTAFRLFIYKFIYQEVCNLIIGMARKSLDPQKIFHDEV